MYLYGAQFTLVTDHKPLEWIFNNPKSKPPARIERWGLRMQSYNFIIQYKSGKDNPADYMSRHPLQYTSTSQSNAADKCAEDYVNFSAVSKAMTLQEIQIATKNDVTLSKVAELIKHGGWEDAVKKVTGR